MNNSMKPVLSFILVAVLSACGGGGGGGTNQPATDPGTGTPTGTDPNTNPGGQNALLPCVNTATNQCSGGTVLRTDNTVTLTDSGVQVYGISTSDTKPGPKTPQEKLRDSLVAWGLAPANPAWNGLAEVRLQKDAEGRITRSALLLSNVGISWDGTRMRPPVVDIFTDARGYPTQGRVTLQGDANRSIALGPLPPSSDLSFYDWAEKGTAGTQANYGNNVYFPRSEPIRCDDDPGCETDYARYAEKQMPRYDSTPGDWRTITGATNLRQAADEFSIMRFHEDGDLRAGDAKPGPNGERRYITDSGNNTGFGVSYPGFKGYRALENYGYQYANLSSWLTMETVEIVEWTQGGTNEHNKVRRGMVAFGSVTDAASIPGVGTATGNVTYRGAIYGYYAPTTIAQPRGGSPTTFDTDEDARHFRGEATIVVNFGTGAVTVTFDGTNTWDAAGAPVPSAFSTTTTIGLGNAASNPRNFFTASLDGTVNSATRQGRLSGRFFGPVSGGGPAEIGGALSFTLNDGSPNGQQTVIGGFLARKL